MSSDSENDQDNLHDQQPIQKNNPFQPTRLVSDHDFSQLDESQVSEDRSQRVLTPSLQSENSKNGFMAGSGNLSSSNPSNISLPNNESANLPTQLKISKYSKTESKDSKNGDENSSSQHSQEKQELSQKASFDSNGSSSAYSDSRSNLQYSSDPNVENNILDEFADDLEDGDFPDYANDKNKEIHKLIQQKKKEIQGVSDKIDDMKGRYFVMTEHLKNVESEIIHTETINHARKKETDSEKHFNLVMERQLGKVTRELEHSDIRLSELKDKQNDAQRRIFENSQKIEEVKQQIDWNQQEVDEWLQGARQKEEDRIAMEKYHRADDSKVKELSLAIEKLTSMRSKAESELQKEVTETQALQIQLNKISEEFEKQHSDRHRLFEQWDSLLRHLAIKNNLCVSSGEKMANEKIQNAFKQNTVSQKLKSLKTIQKQNSSNQEEIQRLEKFIFQQKSEDRDLKQSERDRKAELRVLQNRLSAFSSDLERKRQFITSLENGLTVKQKRLSNVEAQFNLKNKMFQGGKETEQELEKLSKDADNILQLSEKEYADFVKQLAVKKNELYSVQKDLYKLKQHQSTCTADISGFQTKIKNMTAHSNKLFIEIQKQQELLYNAEYQIQLLERKVARAQGEKTVEETDYLVERLKTAKEEQAKSQQKYQTTLAAMKQLGDEHRSLDKRLKSLEEEERKLTVLIEKLNLENDMTSADLSALINKKEEILVQNNIMKLEIKKLQDKVLLNHNNVLDLEHRKTQISLSMSQREKEIQLHHAVLQAEHKIVDQERHKAAIELTERRTRVKNLQIKYQALIQSKQGKVDIYQHSQAYYIIKAAQEKEEIERKDEELKGQIQKSELELKALLNTLDHLRGRNSKFREI